jgi:virginiamycin B lyase
MGRIGRVCLFVCLVLTLLVVGSGRSHAASPAPTFGDLNPGPTKIVRGTDGALWFTEHTGNRIGRLTVTGVFSFYAVPTPRSGPLGIAAVGTFVWFTEEYRAAIGRLNIVTGQMTEFPIPTSDSWPTAIAVSKDGDAWFTELHGDRIGRVDPLSGTVVEYPLHSGDAPNAIVAGPDGGMWFTENQGQRVGRIAADGGIRDYSLVTKQSSPLVQPDPEDIVVGPDGALWIAEPGTLQVARLTTTGVLSQFSGLGPTTFALGPDGGIWYLRSDDVIGRLDAHGKATFGTGDSQPPLLQVEQLDRNYTGITAGPDGEIWLAASQDNTIVRLQITGTPYTQYQTYTRFQIPGSSGEPIAVAAAPGGALWIAQPMLNAIGRRTADGRLQEFIVPTRDAEPNSLAVAADGSVWFSEPVTEQVGHLTTTGVFSEYPLTRNSDPVAVLLSQDGHTLWVAERGLGLLARLDTGTEAVTAIPVPGGPNAFVDALALGPQGTIWFGMQYTTMLGVVDANGTTSLVSGTHDSTYGLLRTALEGGVWVAGQLAQNRIDRATGADKLDRYYLPTRYATPEDIVENRLGSAWFTEGDADQVAHIDMASRKVTEYPVPTALSFPAGICVDSQGTIWFTERAGNALATVSADGVVTEFPLPTVPESGTS